MSDATPPPERQAPTGPSGTWQDLPLQEQIEAWNAAVPNSAERMFRQVEADYEHRRHMDRIDVRFRVFGAVFASTLAVAIVGTAYYVIAEGSAAAGAGLLGTGVAGLVGIVLQRNRNQP
ncbi:hypothetical protein ACWGII_41195 [Streptomyces sp. NPDC054855]